MLRLFDKDMNEVEYDINSYITDIFPLENFSAFGLVYNGFYFQTGEHAFQFLKFNDSKICDEILKCRSPYEARNLGRLYRDKRISKWNDVKYDYTGGVTVQFKFGISIDLSRFSISIRFFIAGILLLYMAVRSSSSNTKR